MSETRRSALTLYNTMKRAGGRFSPRYAHKVKLFTCGPSVYRPQHLGNYRTFFYEDILHRYLEYLNYDVLRVLNYTDIEDKSIAEAQHKGLTPEQLTAPIEEKFVEDCDYLSIRLPPEIPRSSTSVETAAAIIAVLRDKGHAYGHGRDFYFDPLTFEGFGRLFRLDMSKWPGKKRRFSRDTYPGRRWNLGDFILWHGCGRDDTVCWDTDIGRGRPAWNVQDPAMIVKHLGTEIDISCGGIDNLYRHHDYTIAVVEGYSGVELAPWWLHGEHLLVDGSKMSKSKGNVLYPDELRGRGYDGAAVRYFFAGRHYRSRLNFTYPALEQAARDHEELVGLSSVFTRAEDVDTRVSSRSAPAELLLKKFDEALGDDLHTDTALPELRRTLLPLAEAKREGRLARDDAAGLKTALSRIDSVLQIGL